ncbi:MAG TPA: transglycosylase SLT domain-containing protein [Ideonella sp.]|nr:transglycosylase SLT domain-containing protein [Ideonella sp.]
MALAVLLPAAPAHAQAQATGGDDTILDARDALRRKDRDRLAADRAVALADHHPLALWVDYWELNNRLASAQQDELDAFYARWPGSYVEDRLRNDWLLELGRRRDWRNFAVEYPRFRMDDDREVKCYALLVDHLEGKEVTDAARAAWAAQRDADDGCAQLAQALYAAKVFGAPDIWRKARLALDAGRPRAAQQAVAILGPEAAKEFAGVLESPARYLLRRAAAGTRRAAEMTTLALLRMAGNEPEDAARQLDERWARRLPADLAAWIWASTGRQAAQKLQDEAPDYYARADRIAARQEGEERRWSDDTLAWQVRAALRAGAAVSAAPTAARWQQVLQGIAAMSPAEQREATWVYWKARALRALAPESAEGDARRAEAQELLRSIAGQMSFYGLLAADDLGLAPALPAAPAPPTAEERAAAAANPGLTRALQLIGLGLRSEGVREWNFSLRGMNDRELLAAAARACEREVWDRCINTSDRTRAEVDLAQRFPTPFREQVVARTREIGLDAAYVYGLIRQESRFVMDARSGAGASGLMQIMPATARWTAKKTGIPYSADMLTDRDVNLRIGTSYLKLVLDDFGGSQALAAAAYNAGPSRPRRWRDGPPLEVAAWAENIPFPETRDYVKKVLANATWYAALIGGERPSLKARLGRLIGPRDTSVPEPDPDLP